MDRKEKVEYVKRQGQSRSHMCHWPGCGKQCPPAMWGCKGCWMRLPLALREKLWRAYKPGQETTMSPSREYVAVAREIQQWIAANHPPFTGPEET